MFQNMTIPVIHDFAITPDLVVSNYLWNPMPAVPGGPVIGNQPDEVLTIVNVDSGIASRRRPTFSPKTPALPLSPSCGPVARTACLRWTLTTTNGTAIAYTNYVPLATNVVFTDGQVSNVVLVPLIHETAPHGSQP